MVSQCSNPEPGSRVFSLFLVLQCATNHIKALGEDIALSCVDSLWGKCLDRVFSSGHPRDGLHCLHCLD